MKNWLKLGGGLVFERRPFESAEVPMEQVLGYDPGAPVGTDIDRSDLVKRGVFQDGSNVCVAVDMYQQLYMRSRFLQAMLGPQIVPCEISILGHYWIARARGAGSTSKDPGWKPFDFGCRVSDAWAGAAEVGLIPASAMPFETSKTSVRPQMNVFQKGGTHRWLQYSYLPAVQDQIRAAVWNGYGVGMPLPVDSWMTEWRAADGAWHLRGKVLGYHMVTVCGATSEGMLYHTGWRGWNGGNQIGLCSWDMLDHPESGLPVMLRASDEFLKIWRST